MCLTDTVIALIEEAQCATVDDLMPEIEGYTRQQVMTCINNAVSLGRLTRIRRGGPISGAGGSLPGIYGPAAQKARPLPPNSVWQLGAQA